uniref:Uncharacterized protein n=1 Tax=Guillardia theta TaxID=55529 RepID=A0A7S4JAC4_GUITH
MGIAGDLCTGKLQDVVFRITEAYLVHDEEEEGKRGKEKDEEGGRLVDDVPLKVIISCFLYGELANVPLTSPYTENTTLYVFVNGIPSPPIDVNCDDPRPCAIVTLVPRQQLQEERNVIELSLFVGSTHIDYMDIVFGEKEREQEEHQEHQGQEQQQQQQQGGQDGQEEPAEQELQHFESSTSCLKEEVSSLAHESQVIGFYGQASETREAGFKFEISVSFLDMKLLPNNTLISVKLGDHVASFKLTRSPLASSCSCPYSVSPFLELLEMQGECELQFVMVLQAYSRKEAGDIRFRMSSLNNPQDFILVTQQLDAYPGEPPTEVTSSTGWFRMPALLDQWWGVTLRSAAFNVLLMNSILASPSLQQTLTAALPLQCTRTEEEERQVVEVEKMPVVVMNIREREDRKQHMASMLHRLGFENVSFPLTISRRDVKEEELVQQGKVSVEGIRSLRAKFGQDAIKPYIAHALSYTQQVQMAISSHSPWFAIMEDDLVPAFEPSALLRYLSLAISQLPPSGDILYLEYCWEDCQGLLYSQPLLHNVAAGVNTEFLGIARAVRPACTGAIVMTEGGAKKVARALVPIFHGLDDMIPRLIEEGVVEAYVTVPPLFYQSSFFGSDAGRRHLEMLQKGNGEGIGNFHAIVLPACLKELNPVVGYGLVSWWEQSDAATRARASWEASFTAVGEARAVGDDDTLVVDVKMVDLWGWWGSEEVSLAFWSRMRSDLQFDMLVGRTAKGQRDLVLFFQQDSDCFNLSTSSLCNLLVEAEFVKEERYVELYISLVLLPA